MTVRRQRFTHTPPAFHARRKLHDGLHTPPPVDQLQRRNAQAVHHDTEQHEEVDDRTHSPEQILLLVRLRSIEFGVQMARMLNVEHRSNTDRPKVSHEKRFLPRLHRVRHRIVHDHHCRNASQQQDQDPQRDQSARRDACDLRVELGPRQDGTDVHEAAEVEQDVDGGVDFIVSGQGLLEVGSVPIHCGAGAEACEEVVKTGETRYADCKETEGGRVEKE